MKPVTDLVSKHLFTRRWALRQGVAALAMPLVLPASVFGREKRTPPSERIAIGCIGVGAMGSNNMKAFLHQEAAQVVAVCDVHDRHYRDKPWGEGRVMGRDAAKDDVHKYYAKATGNESYRGCRAYADFREVCARDDIDAVVVATPDHWHAPVALEALRGGKDIYGEKPVTRLFKEGQQLYREVKKQGAIFQTGSQQRSSETFHWAVELVLNGHLGKLQRVEVGLPTGYDEPKGDPAIQVPPKGLDYDFWCGPSKVLPYRRALHHRWWRGNRQYGGGTLMDFIGHHNDIAHWAMGMDDSGPVEVEALGWTWPTAEFYDAPVHYEIKCTYGNGVMTSISDHHQGGAKFIGDEGWVFVNRGVMQTSDPAWRTRAFDRGPVKAYRSPGHHRNFLDGVKTRKVCIAPAETAHRSITPGHLGYVAQAVGRKIKWNPEREEIIGDPEAMKLLTAVEYRKKWG